MPWFSVDDGFYDHPKVIELQSSPGWEKAMALWVLCGSWASKHLTDGQIPRSIASRMGGDEASIELLISSGLWKKNVTGFCFHDWSSRNPSKKDVLERRRKTAERVNRFREKKSDVTPSVTALPTTLLTPLVTAPFRRGGEGIGSDPISGSGTDRVKKPVAYPDDFLQFWANYPRKEAKGAAVKAWRTQKPPLDAVVAALRWQRTSADWCKDGGKFIPHPATYLNARRWEDERPGAKSAPEIFNQYGGTR